MTFFFAHQIRVVLEFHCTDSSFLAHWIMISACFTWLTVLISPMLFHSGPDKNHLNLMHWLYRKSHIYVVK